jgi:LysR family transcriptional regulator, glycine cleavage system transcriptional activator
MTRGGDRITLLSAVSAARSIVMRRLPPLPELLAFECVARLLSFTRAAAELCITQSGVSHRVSRLEKYFGKQLIRRMNPGLALTDAGSALLPEVLAALSTLERLGGDRERRLRVAAASSLCTWWLARRLPTFMSLRPGLSIELVPIENDASSIPHVDVRILWVGKGDDTPGPTQMPLAEEQVFPVCSPNLLPKRMAVRDLTAIAGMTLLHKATHSSGEWSWENWFDRADITSRTARRAELRFSDSGLLLSAAIDGAGVALSRSLLAHDALRDGKLIVPVTALEPMTSSKKHVARWRRAKADDPDVNAFVHWLANESQMTADETDAIVCPTQTSRTVA